MIRVIWAFFVALLCLPMPAQAFGKISPISTVAVIDLGYMGETVAYDPQSRAEMARILTEYIGFHLSQETKLNIIKPEDLGHIMDEQALAGELAEDKAIDLGKLMKADYILCGNILGFGIDQNSTQSLVNVSETKAKTKLNLKLIDVKTGSILASAIADGVSGGARWNTGALLGILKQFKAIHVPLDYVGGDTESHNMEIFDNSLMKAANVAVAMLLEKVGLVKQKQED